MIRNITEMYKVVKESITMKKGIDNKCKGTCKICGSTKFIWINKCLKICDKCYTAFVVEKETHK